MIKFSLAAKKEDIITRARDFTSEMLEPMMLTG
jgi:hypothetical protein